MNMDTLRLFLLLVSLSLLPFENLRGTIFGIPLFASEGATLLLVLAILPLFFGEKRWFRFKTLFFLEHIWLQKWFFLGLLCLLLGVITSLVRGMMPDALCPLEATRTRHGLGILLSWFLFPLILGYSAFILAQRYSKATVLFLLSLSFIPLLIFLVSIWISGGGFTYDQRFQGHINSPNVLAMYLVPAALLFWYFFRRRGELFSAKNPLPHIRHLFFALFFLSVFFLISTQSFSGSISFLGAFLFFEYSLLTRRIRIPLLLAGIFTVLLTGSIFLHERFDNQSFFDPNSRSSLASRVMIWKAAGLMIAESPVFGIGPGNFGPCYLSHQRFFPPYLEWSAPEPHNLFLAFWLGSGILGTFGFFSLLLLWLFALYPKRKEKSKIALLFLAIVIALLLHGLFDTPYWRAGLAGIFWTVFFLGLQLLERKSEASLQRRES